MAMSGAMYCVAVSMRWMTSPMKMKPERAERGGGVSSVPVLNPGSPTPLTSSCYRHLPQEMPIEGEIEGEDDPLQEEEGMRTAARKGES